MGDLKFPRYGLIHYLDEKKTIRSLHIEQTLN